MPPKGGGDSDVDDGNSDVEERPSDFDERMNVECNLESDEKQECPQNSTKSSSKRRKIRHWEKQKLSCDSNAAVVLNEHSPNLSDSCYKYKWSPVDMFRRLFDIDFLGFITTETNNYALQRGDARFHVTESEMYKFLGILLVSGYVKVPSKRNYWEATEDTYNMLIANAMPRNRFDLILKYLHFNDNMRNDGFDKLYKIRPLIDHMNSKFLEMGAPLGTHFSIDEAMEPYYGRNSMKQFVRGKPIRFGFKFWCLCTHDGYLIKFIPYQGK